MRRFHPSVFVLLAACGSSAQDEAVDLDPAVEGGGTVQAEAGSGGSTRGSTGGGGGTARPDAGTGGTMKTGAGGSGGGAPGTGGSGGAPGAGGSGGAATGGRAGTGGVPDAGHTVSPCTALPAAGTWENISPYAATIGDGSGKNYAEAVIVDPFDPATVWLSMGYRGVFRSTDCGATFTHMNIGRNGASIDNGSIVSMAVDPVHKGVMYATPIYGSMGVWKTTNGGVDWDPIVTDDVGQYMEIRHFDSVSMDPNDSLHLVFGMHGGCTGPYAPTCEIETTDGGATWSIFKLPTAGWEEGAGPWVVDSTTWLYGGLHLYLTTDRGKTWKNLDPDPAQFYGFSGGEVELHSIPRAADGTYFLTCGQGVVQSKDARSWSLIPIGRSVGFAMGGGKLFTSDEWSTTYRVADESDPTKWTVIPPAPAMASGQGAPFIDYDAAHHVLYASTFAGGLWRLVVP